MNAQKNICKRYLLFNGIGRQRVDLDARNMKEAVMKARDIRKQKGAPFDFRTCRALISIVK